MNRNTGIQQVHPLVLAETSYILNWQRWKELWATDLPAEFRQSLLHFGFQVQVDSPEEHRERICFYCDVADGHLRNSGKILRREGDDQDYLSTHFGKDIFSWEEVRRTVAHKAFQVLSHNFFRDVRGDGKNSRFPSWARDVVVPEVLEKVLWFFHQGLNRPIENFYESPDGKSIHARTAREFILNLCSFAWQFDFFEKQEEVQDREIKNRLRQVWPQLIEILAGFSELHRLLSNKYELDAPCLKKLEELALNPTLSLPSLSDWGIEKRQPTTLEEAWLGGSPAARVLLLLQIRQTERDRIGKVRDLEIAHRETGEALKEAQT